MMMETYFWWNNAVLSLVLPLWGLVDMVLLPGRHLQELYGHRRQHKGEDVLLLHMTRVLGITFALVGWSCYLCKVRDRENNPDTVRLFSLMGAAHNTCMLSMIVATRSKLGSQPPLNGYAIRTLGIVAYYIATLSLEFLWTLRAY